MLKNCKQPNPKAYLLSFAERSGRWVVSRVEQDHVNLELLEFESKSIGDGL